MGKSAVWVIAGAAVLATAGTAHAQQRPAPAVPASEAQAVQGAVPWYQRFTTTHGVTESILGETGNERIQPPAWTLSQRWGVTVDVREAQRIERLPDGGRGDQTSVGAYYQFTPSVRVGGAVSVENGASLGADSRREDPRADVRVESAFRF